MRRGVRAVRVPIAVTLRDIISEPKAIRWTETPDASFRFKFALTALAGRPNMTDADANGMGVLETAPRGRKQRFAMYEVRVDTGTHIYSIGPFNDKDAAWEWYDRNERHLDATYPGADFGVAPLSSPATIVLKNADAA